MGAHIPIKDFSLNFLFKTEGVLNEQNKREKKKEKMVK